MYNEIIDVLPISLLLIFVFKIQILKPLSIINENYLSITTCRAYKGLFALVVIFHHLAQRTESGLLFHQFTGVGYFAVATFFFFSGYGLQKSYINSEDYKRGFLLRRLPTILIPYIVVTFLYWVMNYVIGNIYTAESIIVAIIKGLPIDPNSWYIISILAFYIVFFLLMVLCRKRYFLMLLGAFLWYVFYVSYCLKMGYGDYWFNASHLLILGIFWATYEKQLLDIVERHYLFITVTVGLIFTFLICMSGRITSLIPLKGIGFIMTVMKACSFTVSVILFSLRFKIGNTVLDFLGKISFELYVYTDAFEPTARSF